MKPPSMEDREEQSRWVRLVESQQLASVMNDTRWKRAMVALEALPGYTLRFRVKSIEQAESTAVGVWTRGVEHAGWFRWIEWMDVNPKEEVGRLVQRDFTDEIVAALRGVGARFSLEGRVVRIWGYLRPGSSPVFL